MHVSFGLIDPLKERVRSKEQRYLRVSELALEAIEAMKPRLS
jgi:folate-dependent tRNA-U54 methylase TrmFO/GidA